MSVVLPAPFSPKQRDDLAAFQVDRDVVICKQCAEPLADAFKAEDGFAALLFPSPLAGEGGEGRRPETGEGSVQFNRSSPACYRPLIRSPLRGAHLLPQGEKGTLPKLKTISVRCRRSSW